MAKELGMSHILNDYVRFAYGANTTSLRELSSMMSVVDGGVRHDIYLITKLTDRAGTTVYRYPQTDPTRVLDPITAARIATTLQGVLETGTAHGHAFADAQQQQRPEPALAA
jgi:membrane peptidoglycan carboxypeptidase